MSITITVNDNHRLMLSMEQARDWGVCWNFLEEQEDLVDIIDFPANIQNAKGDVVTFTSDSISLLQQAIDGKFSLFMSDEPTEEAFKEFENYIFKRKMCRIQDVINILILVNFMDNQKFQNRICGFIARLIRGKSADEIREVFTK